MNKTQLIKYRLVENNSTRRVAEKTGATIYEVDGFKKVIVSTWDFEKEKECPDGIWTVSKITDKHIYQIYISQTILETTEESAVWAASLLELQIYMKDE